MTNTSEERLQIASTILAQLGGSRFRIMTGARDMMALESGLQFSIPGKSAKDGINRVRILLTPADTYTVEYLKIRGTSVQSILVEEDIYFDGLINSFERATGLATSL